MQWVQRGVLLTVAAGILAATAPRASGQDNVYNPNASTDTLTLAPAYRFAPLFANKTEGGVSWVQMMNRFNTSMTTPFGPLLDFSLSKDEKHYRLQDKREETKLLSLSGLYVISPGLNANVGYSDSRVFNRSVAVGGSFQDFIFNDNALNGGANYTGVLRGARVDAVASGGVAEGERAYKTDETVRGSANGGFAYDLMRKRVVVQARGALRESSERSRTTLEVFDGLGASEDSIIGAVRVSLADSILVRFDSFNYSGVRDYADQAVASQGGQVGGAENVIEETETRSSRLRAVALTSQLWTGFKVDVAASHEDQLFSYAVQTTRFSETVTDGVRGSVSYVTPWKTQTMVQFENFETLRNFGEQSVASFTENRQRASVSVGHQLRPTFRVDLNASTQLTQSFYLKYEANPRDRDQADNILNVRFSSQPFEKVSADITLAYSSTQFINIDSTQSRQNRFREQYELRPSFTYTVNDRFTIVQTYGVVIEYIDYDFVPADNFLDRNLSFTNSFILRPVPDLKFRFDYGLYLHDKGSYLPLVEGGEEFLTVDREDRRNQLLLRLDYDVNERIAIFAANRYSQLVDRRVSSGAETITTDGQIEVGTTGNYDWGKNRTFTFMLARVKRFSAFGADKEKDYWDMRSELNFPL